MINQSEIGNVLVTGGAGFIGSHLFDALIKLDIEIKIIDDLSSGNFNNLNKNKSNKKFHFFENNLANSNISNELENIKTVFHLAGDPKVRSGIDSPEISFEKNIKVTYNLLENIRKSDVETILFSSSSAVYGDAEIFPTPENYAPLLPISHYGSSKLACEALISSYCHNYGIKGIIFRLANIIGPRSRHGIIWDFVNKLNSDQNHLSVLGNGKQNKSFLLVDDCIEGLLLALSKSSKKIDIFNLGNSDTIDVMTIAQIVCDSMSLHNVDIQPTGGVDDGRGWVGDVKKMHLDISKIKKLGWSPKFSSPEAVKFVADKLVMQREIVNVGN